MVFDDPLSRESARELAHRELQKRAYDEAKPPLAVRLVSKVIETLRELFDRSSAHLPGGRTTLVLLLLLLSVLVVLLVVRLNPARFGRQLSVGVFASGRALSASEHRDLAEGHAARREWAEAVRERLRAVVRELESRGVLDPRPGRTAHEVAGEAGLLVPALADPLARAATIFDEVWYGGRHADRSAYDTLVEVDRMVTGTRLVLA